MGNVMAVDRGPWWMNGALWWWETEEREMGAEQPWLHAMQSGEVKQSAGSVQIMQAKGNNAEKKLINRQIGKE